MTAFNWDDLRIFLAASRLGSSTAAAARLGVDAATVGRRIGRLETALKATLFIRSASGVELTAAGARLQEMASAVEAAAAVVAEAAASDAVGGVVRLSVAEGFGGAILAPALAGLRERFGDLRIELAANAGFLSPSRRRVDMAVTLSAPTEGRLVVEPLTDYQLGLYASADYLARHGPPRAIAELARRDLVGYVEDLIYAPQLHYLEEIAPGLRPALSSSSIRAQREIIVADGGIGVLPCFMAAGLTRVLAEHVLITRRFWIATHRDVAGTARVRAVRNWLTALVEARGAALRPFPDVGQAQ